MFTQITVDLKIQNTVDSQLHNLRNYKSKQPLKQTVMSEYVHITDDYCVSMSA